MSLLHEGPRKPRLLPTWYKLRYLDADTRNQIREFQVVGLSDPTLEIGELVIADQPLFPEAVEVFRAPVLIQREEVLIARTCDVPKKRAVVVNHILLNPDKKATPEWIKTIKRNSQRIRNFARTARNKGQDLDPEFLK